MISLRGSVHMVYIRTVPKDTGDVEKRDECGLGIESEGGAVVQI